MTVMMTVIIKKSAKMPVMTVMTEESIWLTLRHDANDDDTANDANDADDGRVEE
jgi:hypothetical protein